MTEVFGLKQEDWVILALNIYVRLEDYDYQPVFMKKIVSKLLAPYFLFNKDESILKNNLFVFPSTSCLPK